VVTAKQDSIARLVELLLEHDTVEADGIEQCFAAEQTTQIGEPSNFPAQLAALPQPAAI
jgi:hypothetical protein